MLKQPRCHARFFAAVIRLIFTICLLPNAG
jgi:hypothetical protein